MRQTCRLRSPCAEGWKRTGSEAGSSGCGRRRGGRRAGSRRPRSGPACSWWSGHWHRRGLSRRGRWRGPAAFRRFPGRLSAL